MHHFNKRIFYKLLIQSKRLICFSANRYVAPVLVVMKMLVSRNQSALLLSRMRGTPRDVKHSIAKSCIASYLKNLIPLYQSTHCELC